MNPAFGRFQHPQHSLSSVSGISLTTFTHCWQAQYVRGNAVKCCGLQWISLHGDVSWRAVHADNTECPPVQDPWYSGPIASRGHCEGCCYLYGSNLVRWYSCQMLWHVLWQAVPTSARDMQSLACDPQHPSQISGEGHHFMHGIPGAFLVAAAQCSV